ncbi:interferon-induced protein 44-like isoform X2 [Silurus meridionalis]|nr:interferon-induced protein 44-like isoform X2 [Silurus meridionalis]
MERSARSFPFAFYDVMGAEAEAEAGVNTQDIISALKGHMKEGYKFERYRFEDEERSFPFAFYDVMGAEEKAGVNTQDIISALKGHMKEGYKFISNAPLSESDHYYNRNPSLGDQMHCLVNVIAADRISLMSVEYIKKWKTIRETASSMVEQLNFLLYGLVGAGKSSTINTIRSIFEGRLYVNCLAAAGSTTSQTLSFGSYRLEDEEGSFPFAFYDVMGAEADAKAGVNTQDIISALKGHIKEGYKFSSNAPVSESDHGYKRNPSLGDQMHCLVNVIAADRISMMDKEFLNKWKTIRETASSMDLKQDKRDGVMKEKEKRYRAGTSMNVNGKKKCRAEIIKPACLASINKP